MEINNSGEWPRATGVQGDGFWGFDVERDLDLVRRDEIHRPDTQAACVLEGGLAHDASPPAPAGGGVTLVVAAWDVPQRALSSSAIRKVVRSMAGLGR